jgi:hypothetical protein
MWVTVVVRVLVLSGRVFANYSPRLVSLGRVVWRGVRPLLGLYKNLLFYQCIKTQCFLRFCEKKYQFGIVDVKQLGQT